MGIELSMHIFSTVKPQPHLADPSDDRDLEALGVEIMTDSNGAILVLLIRYYSLDPVNVEGDNLFYSLKELIDETENYYGIPRDKWRLSSETESGELGVKVMEAARKIYPCDSESIRFFPTDDEYFANSEK